MVAVYTEDPHKKDRAHPAQQYRRIRLADIESVLNSIKAEISGPATLADVHRPLLEEIQKRLLTWGRQPAS